MVKSLRTESRSIRPFANLSQVNDLFESVRIVVNSEEFEPGAVVLSEMDFLDAKYRIKLNFDVKTLKKLIEEADIPFVDTALICISKSRMLKTMHIQIIEPLRNLDNQSEILLDTDSHPLVYRDRTGFKLVLAVVLVRNLPKKPLRPHITGTWLGQAKFSVAPETLDFHFSPTRLTDAIRVAEDLPKQSLSFVKIKNDDNEMLFEEDFEKITTTYLDEEALALIQVNENDPLSDFMMRNLVKETLFQLLLEIEKSLSRRHQRLDYQDIPEGSAARNLVTSISSELDFHPTKLLEQLNQRPSFVSSLLESLLAMRKNATSGLRSGDSA